MSTYLLVPGAGGASAYWNRVVPLLEAKGHTAIAIELPGADPEAGLTEYADLVVAAARDHKELILVAQSMGGFTAAVASVRLPLHALIFVNAMIPKPGETAGEWWGNTGQGDARRARAREQGYSEEFELNTYFLHDLPPDVAKELMKHGGNEEEIAFSQPCAFEQWPLVPTKVIAGEEDRFFPFSFQSKVARERVGRDAIPTPGGHLCALSYPKELAELLLL